MFPNYLAIIHTSKDNFPTYFLFCFRNNPYLCPKERKRMPKILLYITAKVIWNFLFWNTDYNENRAHVHVGKRSTEHLCKIWLEPIVEIEKQGDLTDAQAKEVLDIAKQYRERLLGQWSLFKQGKPVRIIKVKKTK